MNRVELEFKAISNFMQIKDSVFAYITTKSIIVDGKEVSTNKVKFSRH
ncbi:hypothetical protein [uncultured Algibacter sp.]|nr:hypothetical protein [uncultured Algibacter sp.]